MARTPENLFDDPIGNYGPVRRSDSQAVDVDIFGEVTEQTAEEAETRLNKKIPIGVPAGLDEEGLNKLSY